MVAAARNAVILEFPQNINSLPYEDVTSIQLTQPIVPRAFLTSNQLAQYWKQSHLSQTSIANPPLASAVIPKKVIRSSIIRPTRSIIQSADSTQSSAKNSIKKRSIIKVVED